MRAKTAYPNQEVKMLARHQIDSTRLLRNSYRVLVVS